jgi:hypothetical protein
MFACARRALASTEPPEPSCSDCSEYQLDLADEGPVQTRSTTHLDWPPRCIPVFARLQFGDPNATPVAPY